MKRLAMFALLFCVLFGVMCMPAKADSYATLV